jgi:hypothetical protein
MSTDEADDWRSIGQKLGAGVVAVEGSSSSMMVCEEDRSE